MKIIHTADLHIDSPLSLDLNPVFQKDRKRELLYNFERLINYANDNGVHIILISGDLFDDNKISFKSQAYILGLIESNSNIDFYYSAGNHEEEAYLSSLDKCPKNLKIFTNTWSTYSYEEFDITGINCNDASKKYLYDSINLKKDKINIVMMHGALKGEDKIELTKLKEKSIDYLALGHIHQYQKKPLDSRGVYVYPGCLEGSNFSDTGIKGFSLIEVNNYELNSEFVPFATRTIHDIKIDISKCDTWTDIEKTTLDTLSDIPNQDIVQVRLVGSYSLEINKNIQELSEKIASAYYFSRLIDESKLKINMKKFEKDVSLKGEFIRSVMNSDLSPEEKSKIIEYGIKALMKEAL